MTERRFEKANRPRVDLGREDSNTKTSVDEAWNFKNLRFRPEMKPFPI